MLTLINLRHKHAIISICVEINGRVLFCGWSYIDLKIINYGSGDGQYAESGESREALVALGSSDSEYGVLSEK